MVYRNKLIILLFLFPSLSFAAVSTWKIVPNESSLTFTGTQNGAPVTGEFKKFTGDIQFDPNQLSVSHVHIVVDMNSLSTSYKDLTETLITPDWFSIKVFPQATFDAKTFTKINDNKYEAKGDLTIRDKTQPVTLQFDVLNHTNNSAEIKGSTTLKRTDFGIGQGEWSSTSEVKDNVTINFKIKAIK